MNLQPENTIRSVDNLGRITLPRGLRARMGLLEEPANLEIFTASIEGRDFICMAKPEDKDRELENARAKLEKAGYKVITPEEE